MLIIINIIAALAFSAGVSATVPMPASDTHLQVYRAVLLTAQQGDFDELTLSGRTTLLGITSSERYRRFNIADMPSQYKEAVENYFSQTEILDLSGLGDELITVRDTLGPSWENCNAVFSHIGFNGSKDAAFLLFTYGCRTDSIPIGFTLMVFLTKQFDEWRVTHYWDNDYDRQPGGINRLQVFFARDAWRVPQEAYRLAQDYLDSGAFKRAFVFRGDSTAVLMDSLRLGKPFPWYSMADSNFEVFSKIPDPDPRMYAISGVSYVFPVLHNASVYGSFSISYSPVRGYRTSSLYRGTYRSNGSVKMRNRPDVAQLLGAIQPTGAVNSWWAYRDTSGTFSLEEIAVHADNARRADFVVIGTLRNKKPRSICITEYPDSITGKKGHRRYYDIADLDIERVLKGPYSMSFLRICFPSPQPPGEVGQVDFIRLDIDNGDRRIWLLKSDKAELVFSYFILPGPSWVMSVSHLDAVMEHIPEPPPPAIECPMTRGEAWNADLTGQKGVTIFFILGALEEYSGRRFTEDSDLVERFYCSEKEIANTFKKYLYRLSQEQELDAEIRIEMKQKCLTHFYSDVLSKFVNSFYDYTLTTAGRAQTDNGLKMTAYNSLTKDVFSGLERDVMLAYLAGAYFRYGSGSSFRFANSSNKIKLIADLLKDLGCSVELFSSPGIPYINRLEFEPTEELKAWFERMPD